MLHREVQLEDAVESHFLIGRAATTRTVIHAATSVTSVFRPPPAPSPPPLLLTEFGEPCALERCVAAGSEYSHRRRRLAVRCCNIVTSFTAPSNPAPRQDVTIVKQPHGSLHIRTLPRHQCLFVFCPTVKCLPITRHRAQDIKRPSEMFAPIVATGVAPPPSYS
jgi:hypothetical protein